ncbi:hypothetical protein NCS52_00420500 [Fusarium sp. LHS14.1]|nr:hypothetical protein NCS52_00420500 [Fusarium sp. LHS14.1]
MPASWESNPSRERARYYDLPLPNSLQSLALPFGPILDAFSLTPSNRWQDLRSPQIEATPGFNEVDEDSSRSTKESRFSNRSYGTDVSRDSGIDLQEPVRDHVPEVIDYTPEITPSSGRYSCPYRKRNPSIFNVCDFSKCALGSFDTVSEVKQHVLRCHQSKDFPFQCRVCTSRFRKRKDLDNHFNAQLCREPLIVNNHEYGIDDAMFAFLKQRRQHSGVETWEQLWNVIFPGCAPMAPVFIPPRLAREKTETSTQTSHEDPDQRTAVSESQPSPSFHPQQGTPDSQARPIIHPETTMSRASTSLRQVGLARVHIEILSLSEQRRHWGHDETGSLDGFDSETDSEGSDDDASSPDAQDSDGSPGDASTGTPSTLGNASQGQTFVSTTGQPGSSRKRNRATEGEGDGNNNEPPEKKRQRQSRDVEPSRRRFACPYQAYGLSDNCFRPSRRNTTGGCDTITRLREHLRRRHMKSYRCERCWKQFDAKQKAQAHPQSSCVQKEMPNYEKFMTQQEENEAEDCSENSEGTWWRLFHLLIPDAVHMEERAWFQLQYSLLPYYFRLGSSLMVPPVNIINPFFQNTDSQSLHQANEVDSALAPLDLHPDSYTGLGGTSMTSQSFTAPIYGPATWQPFEGLDQGAMTVQGGRRSVESDSTAASDRINASSTPASSLNVTPSPALDTSQMQQNYERQKTRAEQVEAENEELRATMSASREQVRNAAGLLDGVLGVGNLDAEVYRQVSRAADLLLSVTRRLR